MALSAMLLQTGRSPELLAEAERRGFLRPAKWVSFVLPSEASLCALRDSFLPAMSNSPQGLAWSGLFLASGDCMFLLRARPGEEWFGVE